VCSAKGGRCRNRKGLRCRCGWNAAPPPVGWWGPREGDGGVLAGPIPRCSPITIAARARQCHAISPDGSARFIAASPTTPRTPRAIQTCRHRKARPAPPPGSLPPRPGTQPDRPLPPASRHAGAIPLSCIAHSCVATFSFAGTGERLSVLETRVGGMIVDAQVHAACDTCGQPLVLDPASGAHPCAQCVNSGQPRTQAADRRGHPAARRAAACWWRVEGAVAPLSTGGDPECHWPTVYCPRLPTLDVGTHPVTLSCD